MSRRDLPSVDKLITQAEALIAAYGRPLTVEAIRAELNLHRASDAPVPTDAELLAAVGAQLAALTISSLRPVINASGVIVHTNLGRAPLSQNALEQMALAARGYSNLEYDLAKGERGSRAVHAEALLTRLTGAEAALVVNNNAAAVMLCLSALAKGKGVLVSRGQLVEIGGGFRIPDVLKQSGAKLVEVGTTNRTHLKDFQDALAADAKLAAILHTHASNFKIIGFTTEPTLTELCGLGVPVIADLGSGALLDTADYGLAHEPTVPEAVQAGATLVAFSGDKLLGGPQAGIIVGRREVVAKLKKHPLARAIRADKLCLAALNATLVHYLKDEAPRAVPVWQMIAMPLAAIEQCARAWAQTLGQGEVLPSASTVGGGSLPGETLPTYVLALTVRSPKAFAARLRVAPTPVIVRIAEGRILIDPRTVQPADNDPLLTTLKQALQSG